MTAEPDRSPETENQNNSNGHGGRICPKCGTPLGQKNLCPDCDRQNGASASEESASARNASRRSRSASGNSNMDRFAQYQQLKQSLANDPKNFASVFRIVRTIQREYADYLPLDYINFYVEMYRAKCPFAVFVALMVPEWNTLYRRFLRCGWGNNRAYLLHPPLSWMYLLLADEKAYQEDVEATSNNLASKSRYTEDSRTYFNNFILSFGRFFEYTFNAVSLSIWGEDYLEFVDTSRSLSNQAKPIKLISVFGLNSEGWQEMVPVGKRVLILYCGPGIEVRGSGPAEPDPAVAEKEESAQSDSGSPQKGFFSFITPPPDSGHDCHIFETYDGLRFQQNMDESSNLARDYTLLYIVEP